MKTHLFSPHKDDFLHTLKRLYPVRGRGLEGYITDLEWLNEKLEMY